MMGGQLPLVNHVLQHTLRSLCGEPLHWVYSIFWRILPRHYPPPVWESEAGPFDRSIGNKRNWILVWEDGYCDFVACTRVEAKESKKESRKAEEDDEEVEEDEEEDKKDEYNGPLQPELFFKMSHDVYNYGEGLMGKIAAEKSHKWIFRDPAENGRMPLLSAWQASTDSYPRTWEAQFKAGIQTIAIVAVGEGLLQLGSTKKVPQDVDFVIALQRKFIYLQSIPGVFAQTKISRPLRVEGDKGRSLNSKMKQVSGFKRAAQSDSNEDDEACSSYPMMTPPPPLNMAVSVVDMPSMYNSLQALLSKLPAVTPGAPMAEFAKADIVTAAKASHGLQVATGASSRIVQSPIGLSEGFSGAARASPRITRSPISSTEEISAGCLLSGGGSLSAPPMTGTWPADPRQSLLLRPPVLHSQPPSTLSSANPGLPNLADEYESYHSFLGQLIS